MYLEGSVMFAAAMKVRCGGNWAESVCRRWIPILAGENMEGECRERCHDRYFGGIGRVLVHDARLHGDVPAFHNVNSRTPHSTVSSVGICKSLSVLLVPARF